MCTRYHVIEFDTNFRESWLTSKERLFGVNLNSNNNVSELIAESNDTLETSQYRSCGLAPNADNLNKCSVVVNCDKCPTVASDGRGCIFF